MKKIFWLILILFFTFFVTRVYVHSGFPYTHDGENHLARFANYAIAVREGQIPPRFAPNLFNHYGYPVFNFNYPLANILSLPFTFAKINYELTFKLISIVAVGFYLLGVKKWVQLLGLGTPAQIFTVAVASVNPYLLNIIIYRGNIGEILALCLLPWLMVGLEELTKSKRKKLFFIFVFSIFALSHNIIAIFSLPLLVIYGVIRFQSNRQFWLSFFFAGLCTVALSLWFWLPALTEKSFTVLDKVSLNTEFFDHFPSFTQLVFAPLRFGFSYGGPIDSLSLSVGLFQCVILLLATIVLLKKRKNTRFWWFITLILWLIFFLELPESRFIWSVFTPIAKYIQFPWRLTVFWEILLLPLAGFLFENVRRSWRIGLSILLVFQFIAFTRLHPADYFHHDIIDYNFFSQSTSTLNENRATTFTFENVQDWHPAPKVMENGSTVDVHVEDWRGSRRSYTISSLAPMTITEPTMNFPGWQTHYKLLDEKNWHVASYVDSSIIGGRIAYQLPAGHFVVHTQFTQHTLPRLIGNSVSIFAGVLILMYASKTKNEHS